MFNTLLPFVYAVFETSKISCKTNEELPWWNIFHYQMGKSFSFEEFISHSLFSFTVPHLLFLNVRFVRILFDCCLLQCFSMDCLSHWSEKPANTVKVAWKTHFERCFSSETTREQFAVVHTVNNNLQISSQIFLCQ